MLINSKRNLNNLNESIFNSLKKYVDNMGAFIVNGDGKTSTVILLNTESKNNTIENIKDKLPFIYKMKEEGSMIISQDSIEFEIDLDCILDIIIKNNFVIVEEDSLKRKVISLKELISVTNELDKLGLRLDIEILPKRAETLSCAIKNIDLMSYMLDEKILEAKTKEELIKVIKDLIKD